MPVEMSNQSSQHCPSSAAGANLQRATPGEKKVLPEWGSRGCGKVSGFQGSGKVGRKMARKPAGWRQRACRCRIHRGRQGQCGRQQWVTKTEALSEEDRKDGSRDAADLIVFSTAKLLSRGLEGEKGKENTGGEENENRGKSSRIPDTNSQERICRSHLWFCRFIWLFQSKPAQSTPVSREGPRLGKPRKTKLLGSVTPRSSSVSKSRCRKGR